MRGDAAVPKIIRDAGDAAARAYREFFDASRWRPATIKLYGTRARQFFRWAEDDGLTLAAIDGASIAAYAAKIAATKSQIEATIYLTPVRGLFEHFVRAGVLPIDPCPRGQPNGRGRDTAASGPQPSIPLSELKRIVLEIGEEDGWREGDEDFQAGLVMIAPLSIESRDPAAIAAFTGVAEPLVREYAGRLIQNGIWRPDGKFGGNWFDPEAGGLSFMLDVWVATGMLERTTQSEGEDAVPAGDAVGPAVGDEADGPQETPNEG